MVTSTIEPHSNRVNESSQPTGLEAIAIRVQRQLCGRVRELQLSPWGHGVVLYGRSRTYYGKQLAQHAVACATTLPIVSNEIVVERDVPADSAPARATLRAKGVT
jgi:hypothetical protein